MEQKTDQEDFYERKKLIATSIASPIATIIAKFVCHPIDTIKSKVQARSTQMHSF
jgi:hypothetical protein